MKKKPPLLIIVLLVIGITILVIINHQMQKKKVVTIQKIDSKGIFVGTENMVPQAESKQEQISREVGYAWDNISIGKDYLKIGKYEEAIQAFKKAYAINVGPKTMVGFYLIQAYEKLDRYDEALSLLDEMENPSWSQYGHQEATQIRTRLLAAKQSKTESSYRKGSVSEN